MKQQPYWILLAQRFRGWRSPTLSLAITVLMSTTAHLLMCAKTAAQGQDTLLLLTMPLDAQQVAQFWSGSIPTDGSVVAANTVLQEVNLTVPSLWWAQQQFGSNLLNYWVAYPATPGIPPRVELLVDQQVWNQTSYINRYAFISQIGTDAKDFGYNVRIFTWRGDLLGAYICNFDGAIAPTPASPPTDPHCDVFLGLSAPGTFQMNSPFGAP
ncbi:MAG: hypothetical protein HC772_05555 [Leptolyngbyaceae cyanobacterium CRU_2_3]|nr:hypothetical protein [Leptolyngbyaceae cyanobacterium CRU_2_3]